MKKKGGKPLQLHSSALRLDLWPIGWLGLLGFTQVGNSWVRLLLFIETWRPFSISLSMVKGPQFLCATQ